MPGQYKIAKNGNPHASSCNHISTPVPINERGVGFRRLGGMTKIVAELLCSSCGPPGCKKPPMDRAQFPGL
jgi:hypothetical protein